MKSLTEIKNFLKKNNIPIEKEGHNFIVIKACYVGDNFYDYGEEMKPVKIDNKFKMLRNDRRIIFRRCEDCCACAGW